MSKCCNLHWFSCEQKWTPAIRTRVSTMVPVSKNTTMETTSSIATASTNSLVLRASVSDSNLTPHKRKLGCKMCFSVQLQRYTSISWNVDYTRIAFSDGIQTAKRSALISAALPDPCNPNPCQNGGTCKNRFGTARCMCDRNDYGDFCNMSEASSKLGLIQ